MTEDVLRTTIPGEEQHHTTIEEEPRITIVGEGQLIQALMILGEEVVSMILGNGESFPQDLRNSVFTSLL